MPPGSASTRLWAGCATPLATCANSFTRRGLTSKRGWRGEARPARPGLARFGRDPARPGLGDIRHDPSWGVVHEEDA